MTDYVVKSGPLVANLGDPSKTLTNGGSVPAGTILTGTGRTSGVWVEAQSPWQKTRNIKAWYHKDYLEAKVPAPTTAAATSNVPYEVITKYDSPNFTAASDSLQVFGYDRKITAITIHHWGKDGQRFENVIGWFTSPTARTSAHYVVEAGKVACLVAPANVAWHAGNAKGNATTIGIELRPEARDADYATAATLIARLRAAYGDLPLIPHKQWTNTACPGRWDLARLDALARGKAPATSTPAKSDNPRVARVMDWYWSVAGRGLDVDRVPVNQPKQCVDVSKHYAANVYAAPLKAYGNGIDVARNMSREPGWTAVSPRAQILAGDVISLGEPYGTKTVNNVKYVYGHTAVVLADAAPGATRVDVAQQDGFNGDTVVYRATLPISAIVGVARPPALAEKAPTTATKEYHVVSKGDTLWGIATKAGISVPVLRSLNPGVDPDNILIGDKIRTS